MRVGSSLGPVVDTLLQAGITVVVISPNQVENLRGRYGSAIAVLCAGCTRPLGHRGAFYRVAGSLARDLDGARPPYEDVLIPPMPIEEASELCALLQTRFEAGVAIVDINDFGGSIRAVSSRSLPPAELLRVLSGNPLGQRLTGTPFGVVRRVRTTATNPIR